MVQIRKSRENMKQQDKNVTFGYYQQVEKANNMCK